MTMTRVDPPTEPVEMPWQVFRELHTGDCHVHQWASKLLIEDIATHDYLAEHLEFELDRQIVAAGFDPADYGDKQWAILAPEHFKRDLFGQKFTDQLRVRDAETLEVDESLPEPCVLAAVAIRTRNLAVVGRG